jgi:hypothetical protein
LILFTALRNIVNLRYQPRSEVIDHHCTQTMTQPFGIDFSAEDLPTVFSTCISCFDYALTRASNDEHMLRLSLVRLHLTRWGKAINVFGEVGRENIYIDIDDVDEVKRILVEMMTSFEALSTITQVSATDVTSNHTNAEQSTQVLLSVLETIASERSGGKSLLDPESLRFGKWPSSLIEEASKFVTELEDYIPAAPEQRELCAEERMRFKKAGILELLENLTIKTDDPWMSSGLTGYIDQYTNTGFCNYGVIVGSNVVGFQSKFGRST